jgi:tetratricopeptide (TPR) repeat protein
VCAKERAGITLPGKLLLIVLLPVAFGSCSRPAREVQSLGSRNVSALSADAVARPVEKSSMVAVRFLEERVATDPDDLVALNKLSNYYLQLYRGSNDNAYLSLAMRAAQSSLKVLGADQNLAGLLALAQAEFALHDFASARSHARQLTEFNPDKSYGYQVLGDALLELGDYGEAAKAYRRMEELDPGSTATEARLAHLAMLHGETVTAETRYANALAAATNSRVSDPENIAWCHWQLGEASFQTGQYAQAERHYHEALKVFPDYLRAIGSMGRLRMARNDRVGAIREYERAVRIVPDPVFLAALGDLYQLSDRSEDAARQYALAERIGNLSQINGALYGRQLAMFYADHDLKSAEAFAAATREYAVRRDIYGADAVAWTALKAGRVAEAQAAMKEALRLGTKDARLFYHAGMIERAAGNEREARRYLQSALTLNPQFDPLQSQLAERALGR